MTDLPSTMPSIIYIQGIPYQIVKMEPEDVAEPIELTLEGIGETEEAVANNSYLGTIDHDRQKIEIAPEFPAYGLKVTLLHEVLHGCLNLINKDDEDLVHMLSYVLLNTLRSNPGFVMYLMEGLL